MLFTSKSETTERDSDAYHTLSIALATEQEKSKHGNSREGRFVQY